MSATSPLMRTNPLAPTLPTRPHTGAGFIGRIAGEQGGTIYNPLPLPTNEFDLPSQLRRLHHSVVTLPLPVPVDPTA